MKQIRIVIAAAFLVMLLVPSIVYAKTQAITATGEYQLNGSDTVAKGQEEAKKNALRAIVEQAGVYVTSDTSTVNRIVERDRVEITAAKVLEIRSVEYNKISRGQSLIIQAKVKAVVDDEKLKRAIIESQKTVQDLHQKLYQEKQKNQALQFELNPHRLSRENQIVYARAVDQIHRGEYRHAERTLRHIEGKDKNNPDVWFFKAALEFKKLVTPKTQVYLSRAIEIDPKDPRYYILRALDHLNYFREEDGMKAGMAIQDALRCDPDNWMISEIRSLLEWIYSSRGRETMQVGTPQEFTDVPYDLPPKVLYYAQLAVRQSNNNPRAVQFLGKIKKNMHKGSKHTWHESKRGVINWNYGYEIGDGLEGCVEILYQALIEEGTR